MYNTFQFYLKKNCQKVLKQSKQQFMHLISTKEVLSQCVLTFQKEKPIITVVIPTYTFSGRCAILSGYIS